MFSVQSCGNAAAQSGTHGGRLLQASVQRTVRVCKEVHKADTPDDSLRRQTAEYNADVMLR